MRLFFLTYAMGFSIASMPGPIFALVATESLRRGAWPGMQAAIAPVCVDAIVMLPLALSLHAAIPSGVLAVVIGLLGGVFLVWLGVQSLRLKALGQAELMKANFSNRLPSFVKGALTHLMNPYPYVFWSTVGLAFVREGFQTGGVIAALYFPLGFWFGASSFNFLVVFLVVRGRRLLPPRAEPYLHMVAGLLLMAAGAFLIVNVLTEPL